MGTDWQPFRLKSEASKSELEVLILEQRRIFFEFEKGGNGTYPSLESFVEFGRADEMPEYADAMRLRPVAENPIFPKAWKDELFTTCFPDEAERLVQKRIDWIEKVRVGEFPTYLKLRYLEQTDTDLEATWDQLRECVSCVRSRQNNWARKESVIENCEQIESLPSPRCFQDSFFESYWNMLETIPWIDPIGPENLNGLVFQIEKTIQDYFDLCRDRNRLVKAEKCGCLAESFDSFQKRMNEPYLNDFFEWTQKWIKRGYGMFLS